MSNVYLVKLVGTDTVVGLAVESRGKWVGTSYAQSGKDGALAPTTVAEVESAIESGAIPLPPGAILSIIGMSQAELVSQYADEGEVFFEHAVAV